MTSAGSNLDVDPPTWPITDDAIREVFEALLRDGSWGRYHGPHCDRLREELAEVHSVEHVLLCSSGTSAVELALRAARVQPGDEVILAAYDYKANFANVLTLQATPVLVDTQPGVPVPDPGQVSAAIGEKTRAILCSHLHGCFAPVDEIKRIAEARGITIIEDACQASGGILDGKAAGSIGDVGILSFGGSKLLTAGRGGAVLTNNATLAQRIRLYTQRGNDAYPLSEMQAAVLLPQLQQLPARTQTRLANVLLLLQQLSSFSVFQPVVNPDPREAIEITPAFYKLAFRYCPGEQGHVSRKECAARLRSQRVAMDPAFTALHRTHSRSRFRAVGNLPNATSLHDNLMTLHHPVLLADSEEISRVAAVLKNVSVG